MFKVTIIDYTRHNPWGTSDHATHYYAGGRRISQREYYRCYCSQTDMRARGYVWDRTECRSVMKNGISRDYTEMYYKRLED